MREKEYSEWMGKQGFDALRHANCCKIAFNGGWESRQTEVDELQKQVTDLDNRATKYALDVMATAKLNRELQKRVDQQGLIIANVMSIASDLQKSWAMFEIGKKLEQALKGESNGI